MTSEERREARYQRRNARRREKRSAKLSEYDDFERVADYNSLYDAYLQSKKGVTWKASVQRYGMDLGKNLCITHNALMKGEDVRKGFICFDLVERGKKRHIQSVHISERVVQRSLCDNALQPIMQNNLIYDNGASQKGKGISFSINRLETHLHRYFRQYGSEGYVLLIDLKGYFDNIQHEPLKQLFRNAFTDERILKYSYDFIDAFDAGIGLGSQISQIGAITYPNHIDHYIKEKAKIGPYGRYMDDSYAIHQSKECLKELLEKIREMYAAIGIKLNEKKTKIVKLSRGFTFLKTKFNLLPSGKIVKRLCRESVVRMRRKLKKFAKMLREGIIAMKEIQMAYSSWLGYASHKMAYRTIKSMNELYNKLFLNEWGRLQQQGG